MSETTEALKLKALALMKTAARDCYGFLTEDEVDVMVLAGTPFADWRLLVRCGAARFLCAARELRDRIAEVEADGDYVRDVSLPAHDCEKLRAAA